MSTANETAALHPSHVPLIEELDKFTWEEIVDLVDKLPYDRAAAQAVKPMNTGYDHEWFKCWVRTNSSAHWQREARTAGPTPSAAHRRKVIAYVAAAAQHVASKMLEQMLELTKQKQTVAVRLKGFFDFASQKNAKELAKALRGEVKQTALAASATTD